MGTRRPWSIAGSRHRRRSLRARHRTDTPASHMITWPLSFLTGEPTMKRWMYMLLVAAFIGASILGDAQQPASAQGSGAAGSASAQGSGAAGSADTILTNGKIITVDDQFSIAQAVAVRGDRIVGVGTNQAITQLAGPKTRRIDLRGRSVVPGMIDNHAHFQEEGAYWTLELRFDGVDSRKQALEMIRAKAKATAPGKWVFNLG